MTQITSSWGGGMVDEQGRARALSRCRLFAGVPEADLQRLATVATARRYRRGQLLVYEGDPGDSLLVVVEGSLKAVSSSPHGEELLLAVVEPGETVGELTVADGGARSATIAALTDATVLRIPREAVLSAAERSPALTRALLDSLASTVRRLTGHAADLVFLDIPRRVAKLLLSLPRADGDAVVVRTRLTQAELADRVGASRQSLNAALQGFQRRGWVTVGSQEIRLHDVDALHRFVG
ncbi:Crp/Fnr family transcriptional regulator [Geodermatophilus sp. CPCC 205761]|uniref:Crp/Fnr family transcriptional regulator n=1 Tax=Geodermatophilus sp. CPCC 205761 TaxID=2936597 RepID=UPI003EE91ED2